MSFCQQTVNSTVVFVVFAKCEKRFAALCSLRGPSGGPAGGLALIGARPRSPSRHVLRTAPKKGTPSTAIHGDSISPKNRTARVALRALFAVLSFNKSFETLRAYI
jgi:hypothetical protein